MLAAYPKPKVTILVFLINSIR